ncbi:MAG: ATP-binding protein [Candidatus Aminicenantia bacterium]
MRLKELIINEFGKFKNKTLDLSFPITLLYGPNESGKTTILEALEYALIPKASLSRDYPCKEARLRLVKNNQIFELEKGKLKSGGKSPFIDFITSMKPRFFRNIFYIRTGELEISKEIESGVDFASHLKEKILELENFYQVKNRLEEELGYLVHPSKRKSKIEEEIKSSKEKRDEMERKRKDWQDVRNLEIRKEQKNREKMSFEKELKEKEKRLEKMEQARKIDEYEKELKNRQSLKRCYEDLDLYDSFSKEDLESIENVEKKEIEINNQIKILKERESSFSQRINEISQEIERLTKDIEKLSLEIGKEVSKSKIKWILILSALLIVNLFLKILIPLPWWSLITTGILFLTILILIFSWVIRRKITWGQALRIDEKKKAKDEEENKLKEEKRKIEGIIQQIKDHQDKLNEIKNKKQKILQKSGVNSLGEYRKKWEKKSHLMNEIENIKKNLEDKDASKEENRDRIDWLSGELSILRHKPSEKYIEKEYLKLKNETQSLREEFTQLSEEIAHLEGEISVLRVNLDEDESQIIKQIDQLEEEIEKKENNKNLLKNFYDILKEIEEETEKFLKDVIEKDGSSWFSKITHNRYKKVEISKWKDFYVILGNNEKKEFSWLSRGTQDQLYFSLRLALAQRVAGEGANFFLILDDPFITFDHQRIKQAINILQEISKEHQIILATKDEFTKELAQKIGGKIIEVEKL